MRRSGSRAACQTHSQTDKNSELFHHHQTLHAVEHGRTIFAPQTFLDLTSSFNAKVKGLRKFMRICSIAFYL